MNTRIPIPIAIIFVFLLTLAAPAQSGQCKNSDELAVRNVLAEFDGAWSARSAKRYAAVFDEEADWENAFGGRVKGRKAIEEFISNLVTQFSSAEETVTETRIWCMSSNMALVDVYQSISGQKLPSGNIVPTRRIRMTQLYEKAGGKWWIKVHRVADLRQMGQNRRSNEPGKDQKQK